jgi:predicted phosphodiesterase
VSTSTDEKINETEAFGLEESFEWGLVTERLDAAGAPCSPRAMRILHITDIHLPMPPGTIKPTDLLHPRRSLGWINLTLRRKDKFADGLTKLAALERLVRETAIDLVVFTGDICHLGTFAELAFSRKAIEPLRSAAPNFICMPGNHDCYLSRTPYDRHFGDVAMAGEPLGEPDGWPRRFRYDDVDVVVLNSTKPNPHLYSTGVIPEAQLTALKQALAEADRRIIVATHFGLYGEGAETDRRSHGIVNADAYRRVLEAAPAGTLCLHGHTHHPFRLDPNGLPTMLCAGSTTYAGREGIWLLETNGSHATAAQGSWSGSAYTLASAEPLPESVCRT